MKILTLNPGSATLKYRLFDMDTETVLDSGTEDETSADLIEAAAGRVIERYKSAGVMAIGVRVVHGGSLFDRATSVDSDVLAKIRGLSELAPLHNPIDADVIAAAMHGLPDVPVFAVFDTAFHRTLPQIASRYAIPRALSDRLRLRRYGAHGISHKYVSGELLRLLGREASGTRLIVCHLGNGASACAVKDGLSVDTSMGLTPLEGLVMGSRSGDIDPGLLLYLLRHAGMDIDAIDHCLNYESGLLGLSEKTADVRVLDSVAAQGDANAEEALESFAYRVRKYIGAYTAALGGLDGLAFTGGIGEHSATMRARICPDLPVLGIHLEEAQNALATGAAPRAISAAHSVPVWVVPTNEELQIARETKALIADGSFD